MYSAVISASAATSRPFIFDEEACALASIRHDGRAALDRTADYPIPQKVRGLGAPTEGCPHMSLQGVQESPIAHIYQSAIKNQQSAIFSIGNRKPAFENSVIPASRLEIRPAPEMVSSGIPALDALTGGLPRGYLTEICGPVSSGRTTVLLATLAAATCRGEFCAVVDASDALDPQSVANAGVELDRLLWVRCGESSPQRPASAALDRKSPLLAQRTREKWGTQAERRLEQVLRATDLLLESGGFGVIVLDLGDLPPQDARRIPLTTWFRFRRAVEYTPTILLAIEPQPIAGSCSSLLLQLGMPSAPEAMGLEQPTMNWKKVVNCAQSSASREAAAFISPARKCRASPEIETESRRDGTEPGGAEDPVYDVPNSSQAAHPSHAYLLTGLNINAEFCSRLERKPARSVSFATRTAWAG